MIGWVLQEVKGPIPRPSDNHRNPRNRVEHEWLVDFGFLVRSCHPCSVGVTNEVLSFHVGVSTIVASGVPMILSYPCLTLTYFSPMSGDEIDNHRYK